MPGDFSKLWSFNPLFLKLNRFIAWDIWCRYNFMNRTIKAQGAKGAVMRLVLDQVHFCHPY
jgi:hypothetical protein